MPSRTESAIAELVQARLVDAEVVRKLVEDRDPDLALQRGRIVPEVLDQRATVDRDPRRQVRRLVEQAVELRLVRVLLLDDDGDVLEPPGELRRQRVQRPAHVLLEVAHRYLAIRGAPGGSGSRTLN